MYLVYQNVLALSNAKAPPNFSHLNFSFARPVLAKLISQTRYLPDIFFIFSVNKPNERK
jgi:hypothetical protein